MFESETLCWSVGWELEMVKGEERKSGELCGISREVLAVQNLHCR